MRDEKIIKLVEAWKKAKEDRSMFISSLSVLRDLELNLKFILMLCVIMRPRKD